MKIPFVLLFMANIFVAFSQITPSEIEWENTIGGSDYDFINSIQQTTDGGYIVQGDSSSNISGDKTEDSNGLDDFWVLKLDANGEIQWQNTIGGNNWEWWGNIQQINDGGYILCGESSSDISGDKTENSKGGSDYWVIKLDTNGMIQWQNTIGGSGIERWPTIQQTNDGGFIIGGTSDSNISGDKTEDSNGEMDYWVLKLDANGLIQWQNTIGGSDDDKLFLSPVKQTSDGGYIVGGYSKSNISGDKTENCIGNYDYWVIKLDTNGDIAWQNTIGGNDDDFLHSIQQTNDGGYILGGYSISGISGDKTQNSDDNDFWVVKLDVNGFISWENTIVHSGSQGICKIKQTSDGHYILGGRTWFDQYDYWVIRLTDTGSIIWQERIFGYGWDEFVDMELTNDGGYILAGWSDSNIGGDKTENSNGYGDYWVVKLGPDVIGISENPILQEIRIYPNPATKVLNIETSYDIEVKISNVLGKTVLSSKEKQININNLPQGVYVVKIETDKGTITKKVIKE